MKSSKIFPTFVFIITCIAFFIFSFVLYTSVVASRPELELPPPENVTINNAATSTYPTKLVIPSLNVSANVQYVGINKKGEMATPKGFKDVAWYKYGTVPGQKGSAVIAGHLDNGLGQPAVFFHLNKLRIGDDIYVENAEDKNLHFKVIKVKTYDYDNTDTEEVFQSSDIIALNLITCDGAWIGNKKTYAKRIVVFTELQED